MDEEYEQCKAEQLSKGPYVYNKGKDKNNNNYQKATHLAKIELNNDFNKKRKSCYMKKQKIHTL